MAPKGTKPNPDRPLTDQQQRFVELYLIDFHATNAAIKAGYSEASASGQASMLLKNPTVAKAVAAGKAKLAARSEIKADQVLKELARIGFSNVQDLFDEKGQLKDVKDWPLDAARAVAGIEVVEEFEGRGSNRVHVGYTKKIKLWDKPKALELMGRHLAMYDGEPPDPSVGDTAAVARGLKLSPDEYAKILMGRVAEKGKPDASGAGEVKEVDRAQHQDGDGGGKASAPGGGHRYAQGGEAKAAGAEQAEAPDQSPEPVKPFTPKPSPKGRFRRQSG